MEAILLVIRLILFAVLAVAGVSKLLDPEGAKKALRDFGTPDEFAGFFAVALPFAEIVFGVCLLFVSTSWVGAAGALVLMVTFTGGMMWQISQGKAPDCHCFGQIHSEPVGKKSLLRNVIFALLAGVLLFSGRDRQGLELAATPSGMVQMVLILFLVILGVLLLGYLVKLARQQTEIVRRLGVLELAAGDPAAVERNDAGDPSDGLPIGAPLPDFEIPDLEGRLVGFLHLLGKRKPFLFLFVGAQCAPCDALLSEIAEWESELAKKMRFIFISHGDSAVSKSKFGTSGDRVVLVEKDRAFAMEVGAKWTPTALFVDADGKIASHIAAGDVAIRRLVEQLKTRDLNDDFVYFLGLNGHRRPDIGRRIPDFSAIDVTGKEVTQTYFDGKTTLVAFSSPSCGHCVTLMEEIREWEKSRRNGGLQLLLFTDGDADQESKLGLKSPIIVDKGHRLASGFGMRGLPSAVLVDGNGTIVTEAAVGSRNIWSLIGGKK